MHQNDRRQSCHPPYPGFIRSPPLPSRLHNASLCLRTNSYSYVTIGVRTAAHVTLPFRMCLWFCVFMLLQCVYHVPSATIAGPETVVIVGDSYVGRHDDPQVIESLKSS